MLGGSAGGLARAVWVPDVSAPGADVELWEGDWGLAVSTGWGRAAGAGWVTAGSGSRGVAG